MKKAIVTAVLMGCMGAKRDPAVESYAVEGALCVEKAKTREEADNCRNEAKERLGLKDAGE